MFLSRGSWARKIFCRLPFAACTERLAHVARFQQRLVRSRDSFVTKKSHLPSRKVICRFIFTLRLNIASISRLLGNIFNIKIIINFLFYDKGYLMIVAHIAFRPRRNLNIN
jgi:hypothetical protein